MCRTMFSISTMASSTRMPVTMVMASRLTRLSEKPAASMAQNAGTIESGRAMADRGGKSDVEAQLPPPVAQEDEHHGDGEDGALDQRLHGRVIGAERID